MTRRQHVCNDSLSVWHRSIRNRGSSSSGGSILCLVSPPRVWVVVNARVTRQLIRATESFGTSWELASMRLLSSMSPDVSRLVL